MFRRREGKRVEVGERFARFTFIRRFRNFGSDPNIRPLEGLNMIQVCEENAALFGRVFTSK